jgi:hypothetical protein
MTVDPPHPVLLPCGEKGPIAARAYRVPNTIAPFDNGGSAKRGRFGQNQNESFSRWIAAFGEYGEE